jgi:hypothetical protein
VNTIDSREYLILGGCEPRRSDVPHAHTSFFIAEVKFDRNQRGSGGGAAARVGKATRDVFMSSGFFHLV